MGCKEIIGGKEWMTQLKEYSKLPCARTTAGFRLSNTELQPLKLRGTMFRWGIDFAGPLPITKRGNTHVLVCIEH